jgi:hypothetical protein
MKIAVPSPSLLRAALLAATPFALTSGCSASLAGARCLGDENCPGDTVCVDGLCEARALAIADDRDDRDGQEGEGEAAQEGEGEDPALGGEGEGEVEAGEGEGEAGTVCQGFAEPLTDARAASLADCTVIQGDISIVGDAVSSLAGLAAVTEISGTLRIDEAEGVGTFAPLGALVRVGGDLQLREDAGDAAESLEALVEVVGDVRVEALDVTVFRGLTSLRTIGGRLEIKENEELDRFDDAALAALERVGADVRLEENPLLRPCEVERFVQVAAQGLDDRGGNGVLDPQLCP